MKINAAVVGAQGADFEFAELDLDGPREDEVLVRLVATGLCHTDLALRSFMPPEMFPRVFGHEGAGVVEAAGSAVPASPPATTWCSATGPAGLPGGKRRVLGAPAPPRSLRCHRYRLPGTRPCSNVA